MRRRARRRIWETARRVLVRRGRKKEIVYDRWIEKNCIINNPPVPPNSRGPQVYPVEINIVGKSVQRADVIKSRQQLSSM